MRSKPWVVAVAGLLAGACASRSSAPVATAPSPASDTLGKFVWHDLVSDDVAAARRFYGELLGWQFTETTRRDKPYFVARLGGQRVAGMVPIDPVAGQEVSQWIAYQSVASVDDAVAAVLKAGGKTLVAPVDVGSVARAAVVADPQGAALGLARLTDGDPADTAAPVLGTFFWMEYLARDPQAAAAFYTGTFGFEREVTDRVAGGEYVVLKRGRARGGILQAPRPEMRPIWLSYVLVSDPAAMAAKARTLGGTVLLEPRADVRKGSLAVVTDPSGAAVALQKYPF
jgi:predicted enzyme related to lactoylglutathione lyase